MINLNKYPSFIEVDSAFGGLAIYKISSIPKNAKYIGEDKNNNPTCEHVRFHEFIKDSKALLGVKLRHTEVQSLSNKLKRKLYWNQ